MATIAFSPSGGISSYGASPTAGFIAQESMARRDHWLNTQTFGQKFVGSLRELHQVFNECKKDNWSGYESMPVSNAAYEVACRFLEALLPFSLPAPSIGAEPDGHITFEWYSTPFQTLSISISPESDIHYAALIGTNKAYGTEHFYGDIPPQIIGLIARVSAE